MNFTIWVRALLICLIIALPTAAIAAPAAGKLAEAAGQGDLAGVKSLLADGASPDDRGFEDATALMVAVVKDKNDVVKALLAAGANVEAVSGGYFTALHAAAVAGNLEVIGLLLGAHADVNAASTSNGVTPLLMAIHSRQWEAAKALLTGGASLRVSSHGEAAALVALGDIAPERRLRMGDRYPDVALVKTLIGHGARLDLRTSDGSTALMLAAREQQPEMVAFLLQNGLKADDTNNKGETPLLLAAGPSSVDGLLIASRLFEMGNGEQWRRDYDTQGYPPEPTNPRTVTLIKASLGTTDIKSAILAAQARRKRTLDLLLTAGADPNHQDKLLTTPLGWAMAAIDSQSVETLLNAGANPNLLTLGNKPLLNAVNDGRLKTVKQLLAHGANPDLPDQDGTTPTAAALKKGDPDIIAALKAAPGRP